MSEETKMQSETIGKLAEALSKAQAKIKGATKDTANPFFKSKYADLASVWDACRDALTANGLSIVQTMGDGVGGVTVITTLAHSSGEWIRGSLTLKPVKEDPQGVGSAITYARRYALAAMVGVAPEDDDGNAASGHANGKEAAAAVNANGKPKNGQMQGPLNITQLKAGMREFARDMEACSDIDSFDALLAQRRELLDQCERDLKDWYYGVEGGDVKGAQERIAERVVELKKMDQTKYLKVG